MKNLKKQHNVLFTEPILNRFFLFVSCLCVFTLMRLQILTNGLNIIDVLSRIVNILVAAKPYMNGMMCRLTSPKVPDTVKQRRCSLHSVLTGSISADEQ